MWPKALLQLFELLPHLSRLLPMADRFLNAKTADAEASRTAMQQMAEGLRGDLGQVTAAHAGLYSLLNEQNETLTALSADQHATKDAVESLHARLTHLEQRQSRLFLVVGLGLGLIAILFIVLIILVLHHR